MLMAFKILMALWPFIKEMLFGPKTARQVIKERKFWVVIALVISFLFAMDVFLAKRIVGISQDYIVLEKKYKEMESSRQLPKSNSKPIETQIKLPIPHPTPPPKITTQFEVPIKVLKQKTSSTNSQRYKRLQKSLSEMERDDEKNHTDE